MEVLHSNQQRAGFGRKPAMVPFRHSKLTEMFQNYFVGDGRAVSGRSYSLSPFGASISFTSTRPLTPSSLPLPRL
jgi:hypothetical protein